MSLTREQAKEIHEALKTADLCGYQRGRKEQMEADCRAVRQNCRACRGKGSTGYTEHDGHSARQQCEYCGRIEAAIRSFSLKPEGGEKVS